MKLSKKAFIPAAVSVAMVNGFPNQAPVEPPIERPVIIANNTAAEVSVGSAANRQLGYVAALSELKPKSGVLVHMSETASLSPLHREAWVQRSVDISGRMGACSVDFITRANADGTYGGTLMSNSIRWPRVDTLQVTNGTTEVIFDAGIVDAGNGDTPPVTLNGSTYTTKPHSQELQLTSSVIADANRQMEAMLTYCSPVDIDNMLVLPRPIPGTAQ